MYRFSFRLFYYFEQQKAQSKQTLTGDKQTNMSSSEKSNDASSSNSMHDIQGLPTYDTDALCGIQLGISAKSKRYAFADFFPHIFNFFSFCFKASSFFKF